MLRRRLDPEAHGSAGYTSAMRMACFGFVVAFFIIGTHLASQAWYDGKILPGVVLAGHNLGGLTLAQARQVVRSIADNYKLNLTAGGEQFQVDAAQLGVSYDVEATVDSAYAAGRSSWLPPLQQDPLEMSYQVKWTQLGSFATSVQQQVGTPPVDASLVVSKGSIQTVPEKSGWTIDRMALVRLIQGDIGSPGSAGLILRPHAQTADIQAKDLGPTIDEAKRLMAVPIILTYNGQTFTPTPSDIGQWLTFAKQPDGVSYKLVPQVDTSRLKGYIQDIATKVDVPATTEKVTIENGVSNTEQAGQNGTAIDQDAVTAAVSTAVTNQTPLSYAITSHTVPFTTISTNLVSLDLAAYVEVNLSKQHLWVWQNHNVIYDSPVTSGATGAGFGTVTGLFSIYYKAQNVWLNGQEYGPRYNYNDFVQYWMPFYSGYGLHDASWRNGLFGETSGPYGYWYDGSHGCINLPLATAAFIYNWSTVGTPVWVHN